MNNINNIKDFYNANSHEVIENALKYHLQTLINYIGTDSFIKIKDDIISSTFQTQLINKEDVQINEKDILVGNNSNLILGAPGTGKTVLIKRLISHIISSKDNLGFDTLLLLKGREVKDNSIVKSIKSLLNIHNGIEEGELLKNNTILFIDGLDEIYQVEMESILYQIEKLISYNSNLKIVLTSRITTISSTIDRITMYQIQPPNSEMVYSFIKSYKWGNQFLHQLNQLNYQEIVSSPLILSQMIKSYEAHGTLPLSRKVLYQHIILLYLNDWDALRNIKRESKFQSFDLYRKFNFFTVLAYKTTLEYSNYFFEKSKLIKIVNSFTQGFGLKESDIVEIIDDLIESTGLLIKTDSNSYCFLHKSIQEYLAANYLLRLPFLPMKYFKKNPNVYAIATSLSIEPDLFKNYISKNIEPKSKQAFRQYELRLKEETKNWL